jgi:glycosyltransferase involved in cell wall biosynthesis
VKVRTKPARSMLLGRAGGGGNSPVSSGPPPRVSVVIPTHNRAGIVVRAIDSVLKQTVRDFELIVVDDASPDQTAAVVERIDDARLRLVRLAKNGGQAHALNVGIATVRGEWVAFLDDDDEWLPNKLELQLARLQADSRATAVYCRCLAQTAEGLRTPRARREMAEGDITNALLMRGMAMTPSAYMVKRSALLEVGGLDESWPASADWDVWLRISQAGHHFVAVPEPLVIYHTEGTGSRVTMNAVAQAVGFSNMKRRWGRLMRERAGAESYERWVHNRARKVQRAHKKLLRKLSRSGRRSDALRYVRKMRPALPWGGRFVAKAVVVVLFGRLPHRISRVRQGKSGAPWVRRLFGAG